MRSGAQEANLIRYPNTLRKVAECLALRTLTDDYKVEVRQLAHRFDYTIVPLGLDQVAHGKQSRARQPQPPAGYAPIGRAEQRKIDPVAQHLDTVCYSAEIDQRAFQGLADRDDAVCMSDRPPNHPAGQGISRK
jgi:hypothetical protein